MKNRKIVTRKVLIESMALGLGLTMAAFPVHAASDTWTNSGNNNLWQMVNNWASGAQFPGSASNVYTSLDDATFSTAGATGAIVIGGMMNVHALLFGAGGGDAASFTVGSASDVLYFTSGGGVAVNAGVTTAQTSEANIQLSDVDSAAAIITNNGSGLLTLTGPVNANVASGNGLLTVGGSGNTVISGGITKTGLGGNALLKTGAGTLTLSNGSVWSGGGASSGGFAAPLLVQQGTLRLNGGLHAVTGEMSVGVTVTNGDPGAAAALQVDSGSLTVSSWLSIGRGAGTGTVSSDIVLNNDATVTSGFFGMGFNGGSALNIPKANLTLNGTSVLSYNLTGNIAESVGSIATVTINDTATFRQTSVTGTAAQVTRVGISDNAVGTINVNGGTASFERDLVLGVGGTGTGRLNLTSGTVNVASTTERWMILNQATGSKGEVTISGGNLNLNTNTDLRFGTVATAAGTSFVTMTGGAITGYAGNGTGGFSATSELDLNRASTNASFNSTFNLDGGTLTIGQIITFVDTGTATFNFNGGTLRAAAATATFLNLGGVNQRAYVKAGGAIIDTNGVDVSIPQALLASPGGSGGLTKLNAGVLTLNANNTYTGPTTVSGGSLRVFGPLATAGAGNVIVLDTAISLNIETGVTNGIADNATLSLAGGGEAGVADVGFLALGDGVNETIATLVLGGVTQALGTYGSTLSGAQFTNNEYFSGNGMVSVVPEPHSVALLFMGAGWALVMGLRNRSKRMS